MQHYSYEQKTDDDVQKLSLFPSSNLHSPLVYIFLIDEINSNDYNTYVAQC